MITESISRLPLPGPALAASVVSAFVLFSFLPTPVLAEKLYTKITREESKSLSSPLKTFICLGERIKPDWCKEFRKSKLVARKKPVPEPTQEELRKAATSAAARGKLDAQMFFGHPDFVGVSPVPDVEIALPVVPEETEDEKAWKVFVGKGNFKNLKDAEAELLARIAESGKYPEANEVLGFAYINGSGVVGKSKVKAYRQYGIAYLKGMARVKPNMDMLWKKFTRSEQLALIHEFKKLREEGTYVSTALEN